MMQKPQFIKDNKGKDFLAVIPVNEYNNLVYGDANLKTSSIPEWHKEILDKDLEDLEINLLDNNKEDLNWQSLKDEIKEKYGY